jgi:hypothetical protein
MGPEAGGPLTLPFAALGPTALDADEHADGERHGQSLKNLEGIHDRTMPARHGTEKRYSCTGLGVPVQKL